MAEERAFIEPMLTSMTLISTMEQNTKPRFELYNVYKQNNKYYSMLIYMILFCYNPSSIPNCNMIVSNLIFFFCFVYDYTY